MITVYGRDTSSNVQIVMWAIAELGLECERHDIGHSYGGNDTPAYLAMNPMGLVPTIRDGDLVMWESGAILRYLAARYGDEVFWPRDPAVRAPLDMWAEWCKTEFGPKFNYGVFVPSVRTAASKRDNVAIAKAVEATKPLAHMLDARIGNGPWLAGAHFTFADILTGNLLYRYFEHEFERAPTPALRAYYDRLRTRPAYLKHNCVSYEPLRARDD
ncbi:MAG: glutathione S-transferase family protein [Pseudomonadota bacterium]